MSIPHSLSESMKKPVLVQWFLRIRPEKISWLRFILEGYDGLAVLSTMDARLGLVRLQTLDCRFRETMLLVAALACDLTPYPPVLLNNAN